MSLQKNKVKNWVFKKLTNFSFALQRIPNKSTPPPFRLMQIGNLFWQSRALHLATELNIAEALDGGEKHVSVLSNELNVSEKKLLRLMRFLCAIGVFQQTGRRLFAHNKLSMPLSSKHENSVKAMIIMQNSQEMTLPWIQSLKSAFIKDATPFELQHGSPLFTYMDEHQQFNDIFTKAMECSASVVGTSYLDDFDWSQFNRLIDLGGSNGAKAIEILKANSNIKATVFDRQATVAGAKDHWDKLYSEQILSRIEFIGGELFADQLPNSESDKDLYLLSGVAHLLNDTQLIELLVKIKSAAGNFQTNIAIADIVAPETEANLAVTSFDMQMLMGTEGRERTLKEWQNIFNEAGLQIQEIVDIKSFASIIVLINA